MGVNLGMHMVHTQTHGFLTLKFSSSCANFMANCSPKGFLQNKFLPCQATSNNMGTKYYHFGKDPLWSLLNIIMYVCPQGKYPLWYLRGKPKSIKFDISIYPHISS